MPKNNLHLDSTEQLKELQDIKRLLILGLLRIGTGQRDIAKALGVSQSSISRMFPEKIGKVKNKA